MKLFLITYVCKHMLRLVGAKHKQCVCSLNARIPDDITEKRVGIYYMQEN